VLLNDMVPASVLRRWLLPSCPAGVEFYPKQDEGNGYGSLIRLPLGVHRLSGRRYPFLVLESRGLVPACNSLKEMMDWLGTAERARVPELSPEPTMGRRAHTSITKNAGWSAPARYRTITEWCAAQDPHEVIGRYVELDRRGMGCCPFGDHHADGKDSHPSFRVYEPSFPGGCCWYCYTWGYGGNVFNFLARYHRLDAKTLWRRLLAGEQF